MKTTKTVWSIFRDLVNSKYIGAEITRQDLPDNGGATSQTNPYDKEF